MKPNRLKQILKKGEPAIGTWCAFSDPYANEILFQIGYDWVLIDTEHAPIGIESLRSILVCARDTDTVPIIRVNNNNPDYIKQALDLGPGGIMVPQVHTKQHAELAVSYSKYPPRGTRGFGPIRAMNYGFDQDYLNQADDELLLIVQIESSEAVKNTAAIAAVDGVDAVYIGPYDLAATLGHLGNPDAPKVKKAIADIIDAANKVGCPWGILTGKLEDYLKYVKRGGTMVTVCGDLSFLREAAVDTFNRARSELVKMKLLPPVQI